MSETVTVNGDTYISGLINSYGRELISLYPKLPGGMFDGLDSVALYSLIRGIKPSHILEVGSYIGRSTSIISQALEFNEKGKLTTCDLVEQSKVTRKNVDKLFPNNNTNTTFLEGKVEDNLDKIKEIDFLFIDGPHTAEFMEWCHKNIFPKVKPGSFICIHDVNLSYNGMWRMTPNTEAEYLLKLLQTPDCPLFKVSWMEDWCLNDSFRDERNKLAQDIPFLGKWGILNPPDSGSLSIWVLKEKNEKS